MNTAPSTISLPDAQRPPAAVAAGDVVGFRLRGSEVEYPLDPRCRWWMIGSGPRCDIIVPDDPYVSSMHAALIREQPYLTVSDRSRNGTYVNGVRCRVAYVSDGALLQIGGTTLVAFSAQTRGLLTPLERLAGSSPPIARAREQADGAAKSTGHVLITGEAGTGKRTLAQVVHRASAQAAAPFQELDVVAAASQLDARFQLAVGRAGSGTVLLTGADALDAAGRAALAQWLRQLVSVAAAPRVIVTARTTRLDESWASIQRTALAIEMPPLRERVLDIGELARACVRELCYGRSLAWPALEVAALAGLDWPGNVAELRAALRQAVAASGDALRLEGLFGGGTSVDAALSVALERAISAANSRRAAAAGLGLSWGSFRRHAARLGL